MKWILTSALVLLIALTGCATVPGEQVDRPTVSNTIPMDLEKAEIMPDGSVLRVYKEPVAVVEEQPLLRCNKNVLYKEAWVRADRTYPDGRVYVFIDTDLNDRHPFDVLAFFAPDNMSPYPNRYTVDLNRDGVPDRMYIDPHNTGKCEDIVPEDTMKHDKEPIVPGQKGPDRDSRQEAEI